jgi:hypothetical protein
MDKRELPGAGDFQWPEGIRLYSKIRVRLIEPPHTALVGLWTPDPDGIGLNRKVSIRRENVTSVEVIAPPTDTL